MACVYKQKGRKSYTIQWIDAQGVRHKTKGFSDKRASEERAGQIESAVARGKVGIPDEQKIASLTEKLDEYLVELKSQGRSDAYMKEIRRLWKRVMGELKWKTVQQIDPRVFRNWLLDYPTESARTRNSYLATASIFCAWLARNNYLEANPLAKVVKFRSPGVKTRKRRAYSEDEFDILCLTPKRGPIYEVAGLSGLRRRELSLLEVRDIQLGPNPCWRLRAEATKSRRAEVLPMLPDCKDLLESMDLKLMAPTERVFRSMPGHRTLKNDLRHAGIARTDGEGRQLDFHSLRYFFCTMLGRSLPIQTVSRLMRHRDIRTTCNLYLDLGLQDLADSTINLPRRNPRCEPSPRLSPQTETPSP
jgi:integrase